MLKKEEYLKTVKRPYPPLFVSLVLLGYPRPELYVDVLKNPKVFKNMAHVDGIWYYTLAEVKEAGAEALISWSDPEFFNGVKNLFKKREKDLTTAASADFVSFSKAYQAYMPALALIFASEKPIENALRQALTQSGKSDSEVNKIMDELNIPLEDNFYKKEEYELATTNNLADHVKKYGWIYARYGEDRAYTINEAEEKLKQIDKNAFLANFQSEKEHLEKVVSGAKSLLGERGYLVDLFQYIIYYRTQRTDIMNRAGYLAIPLFKKLAQENNITYKQLLFCTATEILTNKIPSTTTLDERIVDCSGLLEDGAVRFISGAESAEMIKFFADEIKEVKEIKGQTACKGNIKGVARVVLSQADFAKVGDGEILVTSMTTPEMVPMMKKAAAFITDEGGVTCHAAIIAREMKKPCIIGTKVATRVLKDGDMVEVDADKGIVRILK